MELMRWASLVEDYGKELREGSADSPATDVFTYTEEGEKRWKDLKNRVVEHVSAGQVQLSPRRQGDGFFESLSQMFVCFDMYICHCISFFVLLTVDIYTYTHVNNIVSASTEHKNNGQVLHQNHYEEDGRTPRPLRRRKHLHLHLHLHLSF